MGIDVSAAARVLGVDVNFVDLRGSAVAFLPSRVLLIGQGATASTYVTEPFQSSRPADVGARVGFGSPLHLAHKKLFPRNGDGVGTVPVELIPLQDDVSGVAAAGDITPTGSPTAQSGEIRVYIGEVKSEGIIIAATDTIADICDKIHAAVSAIVDMPVTSADAATSVDFTMKWKGASGNGVKIRIEGSAPGVTFGITQPTGGAVNPDVDDALNLVTTKWFTHVLNCMEPADTATLDKIKNHGEGRWLAQVNKPYTAYTGRVAAAVPAADAETDARKDDRVNVFLTAPGSGEIPFMVAARQLARIAKRANEDPAFDYAGLRADGLVPGADADQWTWAERDEALKKGCSTIEVADGVIEISDVVTMYHPTGDEQPAFRYDVDVTKLKNIIYNIRLPFATDAWKGAPIIPDGQATTNKNARTPSAAVAAVNERIDALGLAAIISDPLAAKKATRSWIDSQNPKRLNIEVTVQLSGNAGIINVTLNFGFYFGAAPLAA